MIADNARKMYESIQKSDILCKICVMIIVLMVQFGILSYDSLMVHAVTASDNVMVDDYEINSSTIYSHQDNSVDIHTYNSGSGTSSLSNLQYYDSPLKQFRSGIPVNDVNCRQNLQLVIKAEDGSPACVTWDTAKILTERGWAKEIVFMNQSIPSVQNQTQQAQGSSSIQNKSPINIHIDDQKLINITKSLFQVQEIQQKYPDVTVNVLSRSDNSSSNSDIPLDVKNIVKYTVTRVLHPQEETRELDFSVYFDYDNKIIKTDVSCGGHVGTSAPNPNQEMMNLCFSIVTFS